MPILGTLALATVEAEEGFIELFNGENLDGWTPSKENPDSYLVKDGKLIVKGGRSHLFYTGDVQGGKFKDFELKVRAKTFPGANSGVYFHSEYQDEGWPSKGYECQVNQTHKDRKKTGGLYAVTDVLDTSPVKDGEWYDYDIIVKGKHIVLKINGEITTDWTEPDDWQPPKNMAGRKLSRGTFAIQAHDPESVVFYKDIRFKRIP